MAFKKYAEDLQIQTAKRVCHFLLTSMEYHDVLPNLLLSRMSVNA